MVSRCKARSLPLLALAALVAGLTFAAEAHAQGNKKAPPPPNNKQVEEAVKQLVREHCMREERDEAAWMEFNLSQFATTADLIGAFHIIRDRVLEYLHFRAGIKGIHGPRQESRVDYVLGRCWLGDVRRLGEFRAVLHAEVGNYAVAAVAA